MTEGAAPWRGRPRSADPRNAWVHMRVTETERARLDEAAERAGMTVSAFLLRQALGTPAPRAARRPHVDKVELARCLAALGRYGSNINQLARAANTGEVEELSEHLAGFTAMQAATLEMRDMLMRALGRSP